MPDLIVLLALVVTCWLLLMVLLQAALNRRVWKVYQWGLLVSSLATVWLWFG